MLNYYDFIFEKFINESYVYYINDFKKILDKLARADDQIAKDLLEVEYTDSKSDTTFISLGKRDGYIGFSTMRNTVNNVDKYFGEYLRKKAGIDDNSVDRLLKITTSNIETGKTSQSDVNFLFNEYDLRSKSRSDIKLGKFINAVLPGKYTPKEIEDFTNKFKANLNKVGENFELVSGSDISFWYDKENYAEMKGTLGSSCMASKKGIFELYIDNPEVCKLLILEEDGKLLGRALIWKLNSLDYYGKDNTDESIDIWFMDRQYTIKDSDIQKFRNYAKESGWIWKANNNHHSLSEVYINDSVKNVEMSVSVKNKKYNRFPYMDTFRRFDPETCILYNDDNKDEDLAGNYILDNTNGGYATVERGIWSEWDSERIPEEFAVWSEWVESYIHEDRVIWVHHGDQEHQGPYPEDHDDLAWDGWSEEWLNVADAVWSESYDYHLKSSEALKVIDFIYSDGEPEQSDSWYHMNDEDLVRISDVNNMIWYQKLSDEFDYWTEVDAIHKSLLTMNSNSEYILKLLKVDIYKVDKNNPISDVPKDLMGIEWLLKEDAFLLGWNVSDEKKIVDIIWYNNSIKSKINKLKSIADSDSKFFNLIKGLDHDSDWVKSLRSRRLDLTQSLFMWE
jgi:hypothetical protein